MTEKVLPFLDSVMGSQASCGFCSKPRKFVDPELVIFSIEGQAVMVMTCTNSTGLLVQMAGLRNMSSGAGL